MGPKASESTWKFGPCECVGGKLATEVTHTASSVVCMSKQQRTAKIGKRLSCICDETLSSERAPGFRVHRFLCRQLDYSVPVLPELCPEAQKGKNGIYIGSPWKDQERCTALQTKIHSIKISGFSSHILLHFVEATFVENMCHAKIIQKMLK